jgi:Raf kinase inhibitor-like YbhB/YbcL family protein
MPFLMMFYPPPTQFDVPKMPKRNITQAAAWPDVRPSDKFLTYFAIGLDTTSNKMTICRIPLDTDDTKRGVTMKLWSDSFDDGARIPNEFVFGIHDPESHIALSANKNPHLAWSDLPEGTKSLALVVHDPDVPSVGDDVNQEGRTVSADLPRVDFYHWVLVDLPADTAAIEAGEFCDGVTARGKEGPAAARDTRQGTNDYTGWFSGDADMEGDYFGYDGPCPPWNDESLHHYHFTLYALDVDKAPVEGKFGGADVVAAIEGHVLDKATLVGTYAINPDV